MHAADVLASFSGQSTMHGTALVVLRAPKLWRK